MRTILELTDPNLVSLCLDIGWVERAGYSPAKVTSEFLDRVRYIHLKDTQDGKFTDLGQGSVDFPGWWEVVRDQSETIYLTHERDEVLPNAIESARTSREYLRSIGL